MEISYLYREEGFVFGPTKQRIVANLKELSTTYLQNIFAYWANRGRSKMYVRPQIAKGLPTVCKDIVEAYCNKKTVLRGGLVNYVPSNNQCAALASLIGETIAELPDLALIELIVKLDIVEPPFSSKYIDYLLPKRAEKANQLNMLYEKLLQQMVMLGFIRYSLSDRHTCGDDD